MSYRRTKEELDAEFEKFLKESVSDDSVDLGSPDKQPVTSSQKASQKATVSWWQDDEVSSGAESSKRRFIKTKEPPTECDRLEQEPRQSPAVCRQSSRDVISIVSSSNSPAASSESHHKPVPKPRSKAPDTHIQSEMILKEKDLDISQSQEKDRASSESQISSTHENLQKVAERSPDEAKDIAAANDGASHGNDDAFPGSGKSFRKSLRGSQPIQEEGEDTEGSGLRDSRGSSEREQPVLAPAGNLSSLGQDTLEEEKEKARFFAQIEAGASSTVDYSKLNRELDSSPSTFATDLRKKGDPGVEQRNEEQREAGAGEADGESPAHAGSPHYSEDFEDVDNIEEPPGEVSLPQNSKMAPILARVSLYDSLDDTGVKHRGKDTVSSLDRGQLYAQSGGSEVEALQEAYRQIHSVEDSDDLCHFSLEDRKRSNRPVSPPPPQHPQQSLQPASTTESDLPTAEELMRPIRPENKHIRGFTLQPVSDAELHHEQKSRYLSQTFTVGTPSQLELEQPGKTAVAAGLKATIRPTSHKSRSSEPPSHDLTSSIRKEAERLMQEQNKCSSQTSSLGSKAKKQPMSRVSSVSHSSMFSERKTTLAPSRGKAREGKAAGSFRSPKTSKAADTTRGPSSKPIATKKQEQCDDAAEAGLRASSELVASVQSLVAVLQQQIDTSSHHSAMQEVKGPQDSPFTAPPPQTIEENSVMEALRVQLAQKEKELQMMKDEAEEVNSLRQQNYLLQSKLHSAEEASQKRRRVEAADPSMEENYQQMAQDIKEQEILIKGYQQENEKLYSQMKAQQAKSKANEEAMFNENQRLLSELALTREQLRKTSRPVSSVCSMDHTKRISDLLAQISILQRNQAKLSEENHALQQEKQSLEAELNLIKAERAISSSGEKTFELRVLEDQHQEEVAALKKKLQWFSENQELLDRDAGRLKAATAEILQLKEQVEKLKQEVGKRSSEQQRKTRHRSADTRRMQDLQRQVKELEQILRSRNPNSLPALIYAAATAAGEENAASPRTSPPSRINALLEHRIQRLESELESHDEEAKRTLRAMEQQFHRIKLRYEQQISELEQQQEHRQPAEAAAAGSESWMSKCQILEEELKRVQDSHQQKDKRLQDQIDALQQQLANKTLPSPGRHQRQAEAAFGVRIERLNQELATKTRSIQELSRTVERLQKERSSMLSAARQPSERRSADGRTHAGQTKPRRSAATTEPKPEGETFPAAQYEKTYQPTVFSGSHISEVLQENEALRQRVQLLQLHSEQEKEELKAGAAQAQEELRRLREGCAEQLAAVKAEHGRVVERLCAAHALDHSSSKVAELSNRLSSQELLMKHLHQQLQELQGCKEELCVSRSREEALQKQLTRLLQELKEAKEAQSSEGKLLCSLERKIINMELRHEHREKELQQVVAETFQMSAGDLQSEVERWRRLAQDKSRELDAFRSELDSILDILRHLQRQGVVLPTPQPVIAAHLLQNP
ncbi:centrosomal protein of 162 kDa isoform X4 [Fundulus heteroclitus]|uniref:centrosomal protein of 162 kDa isoform X4 n=1 Tax=Fundulus heteroclitus TaxID=8078 RepID=UPI00165BBD77|nr:centrosomal protein of 162 kDa isoform X4 [Fundulus heteroclitus]